VKRKIPIILATIALILLVLIGCSTAKVPQVGDKAPDFTLESIDGKSISLSDFRGKTVLVVFTSVTCVDCQKQVPYIEAACKESSENLAVLDIYMFNTATVVRDYVAKKQSTSFVALADPRGKVAVEYNVAQVSGPINFFINDEGIIRNIKVGAFQSQEEIEDILESL
jgi:peroxiredoxin